MAYIRMVRHVIVVLACFFSMIYALSRDHLHVNTTSGPVRGYKPKDSVEAFVGIPFALSPTGNLRFESPLPFAPESPETIIDATQPFASCFQVQSMSLFMDKSQGFRESEDCLFVSVWRPSKIAHPLPVLVSFFGGAFTQGGTTVGDGVDFVEEVGDVIFVGFNYRVNIFGFANTPALESKNMGLLDQELAIKWISDNIENFGGNPGKMTAIGDSAGSISIGFHAFSHAQNPTFAGLIQMSGHPESQGTDNGESWVQVVRNTNCTRRGNDTDSLLEELECMRALPARQLRRAISPQNLLGYGENAGGIPTVDNVTVFTREEYQLRGHAGKFARIPLLTTTTLNEGDTLLPFDPFETPAKGINYTDSDLAGAVVFQCPTSAAAALRVQHDVPVWRAVYSGVFPELQPYPWARAYHGADIWLFFGREKVSAWEEVGPEITKAGKLYRSAIAAFVRDPVHGLSQFGWPRYDAQGPTVVNLFPNSSATVTFEKPDKFDKICALLEGA